MKLFDINEVHLKAERVWPSEGAQIGMSFTLVELPDHNQSIPITEFRDRIMGKELLGMVICSLKILARESVSIGSTVEVKLERL